MSHICSTVCTVIPFSRNELFEKKKYCYLNFVGVIDLLLFPDYHLTFLISTLVRIENRINFCNKTCINLNKCM